MLFLIYYNPSKKLYTHSLHVPSGKLQHNSSVIAFVLSHVFVHSIYLAVKYSSRHQDYCWKDSCPLLQSEGEIDILVSNTAL